MIYNKKNTNNDNLPVYAGRLGNKLPSKHRLNKTGLEAKAAYQLIHDELMLDGNSRLNLATFVTTWMEEEAEKLMAETFDKNMIDKDEYPKTAEIEERCVNIISNLFNAPKEGIGTSAIGSSEAVMLAGMALKWKWRSGIKARGKKSGKPNLILGSNVQVVWEKFCRYWEVEPRYVFMQKDRYVIDAESVINLVDENTIGVVAILGTTYTGEFEPIKSIHDALLDYNAKMNYNIPLHIDAASGGFVAPFLHPNLEWDFRLPLVKSINVSGHKYGLVYPGVGWVIWRDKEELPEELIFHVNYLGGDMPTFTLNFSRPGNQVIAQYYNFIRLGFNGYKAIMENLQETAQFLSARLNELEEVTIINNGTTIPVIAFRMNSSEFNEFDISDALRMYGWQVPAYTMPPKVEEMSILRIVLREGFSRDMANSLLEDFKKAIQYCRDHQSNKKKFCH